MSTSQNPFPPLAPLSEVSPGSQVRRLPFFEPAAGPIGTEVELWMDGLPPSRTLFIGFGTVQEHSFVHSTDSNAEGEMRTRFRVPDSARPSRSHFFFVTDQSQVPFSVSLAFLVTDPEGRVELRGEMASGAEGGCALFQGLDGEVYGLRNGGSGHSPGDRVVVRGRVDLQGPCPQRLAIAVESLEPRR